MAKKQKTRIKGPWIIIKGNMPRHLIVKKVVNTFIKTEYRKKGKGIEFWYPVEKLPNGEMLYIVRPGHKKNFDFKVDVLRNYGFGEGSHKEIAKDLRRKRKESSKKFERLLVAITEIFNCSENDVDVLLKKNRGIKNLFRTGGSTTALLKILKWLFIMEDIVYWDNEGRAFLFNFLGYVSQEKSERTLKIALNSIKNPQKLKSFMKKAGIEWISCDT
ncbi:MAG: hypothetical protein JW749_10700 [Sedimentisphaerales bacterium]|nr:hypothetical protein [Sedimentisphaerales bacterium]